MIYTVAYRMLKYGEEKSICVHARNKWTAHYIATYIDIPKLEGEHPYSSWVDSVTYSNGKERIFNNFEGNPY